MGTNKIKPIISLEASYVFHMLSCAKCGYDNSYGVQFAPLHNENNLKILKEHERLITVEGGEHCGQLYWLLVCVPASLSSPADKYYQFLCSLFESNNFDGNEVTNFDSFGFRDLNEIYARSEEFAKEIVSISKVMIGNYRIYTNCVWNEAQSKLLTYTKKVETIFEENDTSVKLEKLTGVTPQENFYPIFCNSIDSGAEAIDVSMSRHVFGIGREVEKAVQFVTHEYVIYLLKQALIDTPAFSDPMKYWLQIEGLAAYYYEKIFPGRHIFLENREIIEFYESKGGVLSAKELFLAAIK